FLELDHSTLSQMLRGKRKLSSRAKARLGERLGLTPADVERLSSEGSLEGNEVVLDPRGLTLDAFQVIADWYHFAIFELVTVKDFSPQPKWIAKKLGISVSEANIAVERLFRLGLLEKDPDGNWKQGTSLITTASNPFSALAFRRLQSQVLEQALRALEEVPI